MSADGNMSGFSPRFSLKHLFFLVAIVAIGVWLFGSYYPLGPLYTLLYGIACITIVAFHSRNIVVSTLCVLATIGVCVVGFPMVKMSAHPVPLHLLNRIQPGATQAEVESLLGTPTRIRDGDWEYSGFTWCYITIQFTKDKKVDSVIHDH